MESKSPQWRGGFSMGFDMAKLTQSAAFARIMRALVQVWRAMPRAEKLGAVFFPPVFIVLFWTVYVMLPN
ncbi:MAG: hypothetical protein EBT71_04855 [Alphaproteobacteria bacterium]|nr:hypothetical protein [Alphaproteobacteria bacterium]